MCTARRVLVLISVLVCFSGIISVDNLNNPETESKFDLEANITKILNKWESKFLDKLITYIDSKTDEVNNKLHVLEVNKELHVLEVNNKLVNITETLDSMKKELLNLNRTLTNVSHPSASNSSYGRERDTTVAKYTAHLRDSVDLPCNQSLKEPINNNWRRLCAQLQSVARSDQMENPCACENGGSCNTDGSCSCPGGFDGYHCESRLLADPCAVVPCRNGGTCRVNYSNIMNHSCDCPLGYAGTNCQMSLHLYQSVGFNGNGYLEFPAGLIEYNTASPAIIALAMHTTQDGVLLYQGQLLSHADYGSGDYVLIRIAKGYVVLEWDMGSGSTYLTIDSKDGFVTDGERHVIIVRFFSDNKVEMTVDSNTVNGYYNGNATRMDADSNISIGGIRDSQNVHWYPGLVGCIDQMEFMAERAVILGVTAVAGRNAQRCRMSVA